MKGKFTGHLWLAICGQCTVCETCDIVNKKRLMGIQNIAGCPKAITEHIHAVSGPKYKRSNPLITDSYKCYNL